MRMQKKVTLKEDGRYLIYYHFPDTATPEETAAFEALEETEESRKVEPETEEERKARV
ncbi:hypothetical protein CWRG_02010 [Chthonomonas calidirosea]|uniref:Uncharacterized protein n=2 Tax=Chthonomonas TaxID=1077265 RepID=S0EZK4_CHTCT|nr:hypothetical protein [Chthonomonas calidirosea]CCW35873.1 hypothetical protein CCALI_02066 [Chthonomonas calidirosea T49]CEK17963.1 hypothetical protein CWRG_02010 [Chthonomonas calidirosea]CEK17968.1 hypothetical protein CP488_02024 [Chthonomonas calidirosea]CEK18992.1 hypothetical protein CTKA_02029 [Chthonomonas calidirosea]